MFQENLKHLAVGRTVLIIAPHLSTVRHADTILVMDDGRLVESDPHSELLKASGAYASLVEASGLGG